MSEVAPDDRPEGYEMTSLSSYECPECGTRNDIGEDCSCGYEYGGTLFRPNTLPYKVIRSVQDFF